MPKRFENDDPKHLAFSLTFGGGMNTRKPAISIGDTEGELVENIDIDIDRGTLTRRPPYVEILKLSEWTSVSSGETIVSLIPYPYSPLNSNPLETFLIQTSTGNVHLAFINPANQRWEVGSTGSAPTRPAFATVHPDAVLAGGYDTYSELDNAVIITDLTKNETVKWLTNTAGTIAFVDFPHNLGGTVDFYAAHCFIEDERAWFADITTDTAGTVVDTPHLVVGSQRGSATVLSVSARPSSALGGDDAFYLLSPDLKRVDALISALGAVIIVTEKGKTFILSGVSAKDFYMYPLFSGSGVDNKRGTAFAGNDVLIASRNRLDTLAGVQAFGDVENDDYSRPIQPSLENPAKISTTKYAETSLYFEEIGRRVFLKRQGEEAAWVAHKAFRDQKAKEVSGWAKWSTDTGVFQSYDVTAFMPTVRAEIFVFGNTFATGGRIETTLVASGDNGVDAGKVFYLDHRHGDVDVYKKTDYPAGDTVDDDFTCLFRSKMFTSPSGKGAKNITGRVRYIPRHSDTATTATVRLLFAGSRRRNISKTITLSDNEDSTALAVNKTPRSTKFSFQTGNSESFQVEVSFPGDKLIEILGIDFTLDA
jgi:hypothetical protein